MRAKQTRQAQRGVHLAMGAVVAAAVYLPIPAALAVAVKAVAIPALLLTGIAMWQAARLRRLARKLPRPRPRAASPQSSRQSSPQGGSVR